MDKTQEELEQEQQQQTVEEGRNVELELHSVNPTQSTSAEQSITSATEAAAQALTQVKAMEVDAIGEVIKTLNSLMDRLEQTISQAENLVAKTETNWEESVEILEALVQQEEEQQEDETQEQQPGQNPEQSLVPDLKPKTTVREVLKTIL